MMEVLLDVTRAQVSHHSDGSTVFDDPECPWVVQVWTGPAAGNPHTITSLQVQLRPGATAPITAGRLQRLPVRQMGHIAAAPAAHGNEVYYRLLASPKQQPDTQPKAPGHRGWPPDHWERVLLVHQWATQTARPGGGLRAVADLWGVTAKPTAERWLAHARRQAREADRP